VEVINDRGLEAASPQGKAYSPACFHAYPAYAGPCEGAISLHGTEDGGQLKKGSRTPSSEYKASQEPCTGKEVAMDSNEGAYVERLEVRAALMTASGRTQMDHERKLKSPSPSPSTVALRLELLGIQIQ